MSEYSPLSCHIAILYSSILCSKLLAEYKRFNLYHHYPSIVGLGWISRVYYIVFHCGGQQAYLSYLNLHLELSFVTLNGETWFSSSHSGQRSGPGKKFECSVPPDGSLLSPIRTKVITPINPEIGIAQFELIDKRCLSINCQYNSPAA